MTEFYNAVTSYVLLPPTLMLCLLIFWSLVTVLVGVGSEMTFGDWFPSDVSLGSEHEGAAESLHHSAGDAIGGIVLTPAKWLNLRDLPIIVWGGIFTLSWWVISVAGWYCCDTLLLGKENIGWWAIPILLRNFVIALLVTKLITHPMRSMFSNHELSARDLVGEEVSIASYDASPTHGQARFKTDAAPLLLNIRTDGPILPKGTRVWITHYDAKSRVYIVSATTTTTPISTN